jgi:peptide/nickel transport system permease protein
MLALDTLPIANAGPDQNVTAHSIVTMNGSASIPSDGATIQNYTWVVTYKVQKKISYGENVSFWVNDTGLYTANLTVRDSNNLTAYDLANILVKAPPKTFLEQYWSLLLFTVVAVLILAYVIVLTVSRMLSGQPVVSEAAREKFKLSLKKTRKLTGQLLKNPMGILGVCILTFFILMAIFGPVLAPYPTDIASSDVEHNYLLPSKTHWLGTDNFGIDIFSELLVGAQTSMIVGIVSAIIASFLGAAVGLYSGYVGGWKDEVVMRLNDVVLSIPWLVLMIIVAAFIGKIDLTGIILIIGLTGWSTTARMVRAQVLSVRERQYVERAKAVGSSDMSIIRRHIFPNTFPLVFANTILTVAVSILSEATLSFLGLRPAGVVTWGTMLSFASASDAFENGLQWWILAPGLCIVAVVLGFTLLGYALDELLNPKLRHR